MAVTDDYLQFVLGQLAGLEHVAWRRMFGGIGLYYQDRFFAIITADTVYFKVGDANRSDYVSRGMPQFRPYPDQSPPNDPNTPRGSMSYYELPPDVLEDPEECATWARRSVAVAVASSRANNGTPRKSVPRKKALSKQKPAPQRKSR
jgi:DNA transformation protein